MDISRAVVLLRGIVDRSHGNDPETRLDTEDEDAVREAVRVLGRITDNSRLCWCPECGGEPGQPDERDRLCALAQREPDGGTCASCEWNEPKWKGQIRCFHPRLVGVGGTSAFKPDRRDFEFGCNLHTPSPPVTGEPG